MTSLTLVVRIPPEATRPIELHQQIVAENTQGMEMTGEHWVTKRLECTAGGAFTTLSAEVANTMDRWRSGGGSSAFQAFMNVDQGHDRVEVHENSRLRAYIAHKPGNDILTASCGRWNFIGQYDEIGHWYVVAKWDEEAQECHLMVATGLDNTPMVDMTVAEFVQILLDPVLFPSQ